MNRWINRCHAKKDWIHRDLFDVHDRSNLYPSAFRVLLTATVLLAVAGYFFN